MRLFVGIDLPHEIKQELTRLQSELRDMGVKGSWKLSNNFHITLEFLGELESTFIPTLAKSLSKCTKEFKPFNLSLTGLGAFPSFKRPHTLWTGIGGHVTELNDLKNDIHTELKNQGFVLEKRSFKPHITLASRPNLNGVQLTSYHNRMLGEFRVNEVILFESQAIQGRRVYTGLERFEME